MKDIKIALVDDHKMFRNGLVFMLKTDPSLNIVLEASNGEELLKSLSTFTKLELPDVIILDIKMPQMNGFETAKAIKEKYTSIKILALSMYDDEANVIKMFKSGADGYLTKGCDKNELFTAIYQIAEKGYYHSDFTSSIFIKKMQDENYGISAVDSLSPKEIEFLKYSCSELTYKDIAEKMGSSYRTIDGYRDSLFSKLNLKSRTGLVIFALKSGIVNTNEL